MKVIVNKTSETGLIEIKDCPDFQRNHRKIN